MDEEIKQVLLNILLKLDEVCHKHKLRYYIAFGTCLGAIRHKGFIPWDHDIDVLMPIEDAKKLIGFQKDFGERYFLQCKETDPEFGSIAYKLRDSETTCIWKEYEGCNFNQGFSIDIYPYYIAPKSKINLLFNIWKSHFYKVLTIGNMPIHHSVWIYYGIKLLNLMLSEKRKEKLRKKIEDDLISYKDGYEILDYYGEDIALFDAITYPREWFEKPKKLEFEKYWFDAPTEPEKYLEKRYGDYMKMPPIEKQVRDFDRYDVILDTNRSYKEYIKVKQKK